MAQLPEWLVGLWIVDDERLTKEQTRYAGGSIQIHADGGLSYGGFMREAEIGSQSWKPLQVELGDNGLPSLWNDPAGGSEVWFSVLERDGSRLRVRLGGMSGLPWGGTFPVRRSEPAG